MSNLPNIPVESNDDAMLRMFAGAKFDSGATFVLPSGRELNGDEMNVFTAMYANSEPRTPQDDSNLADRAMSNLPHSNASHEANESQDRLAKLQDRLAELRAESDRIWENRHQNPLDSSNDRWTGDPEANRASLHARALEALHSPDAAAHHEKKAINDAKIEKVLGEIKAEKEAQRRGGEREAPRKKARKVNPTRRPWWKIWQ